MALFQRQTVICLNLIHKPIVQSLGISTLFSKMDLSSENGALNKFSHQKQFQRGKGDGVLKNGENPKTLTDADWKKRLTEEQYYVTRQKGTERPFTGDYLGPSAKPGVYNCVCCGTELFSSNTKYDSGSGWPSFHSAKPADETGGSSTNVAQHSDGSHGMERVEVTCKQCEAHLGHVFKDGPQPTGERFCINSASLTFESKK